jgi:sulfatase modifying factor 1
VRLSVVVLALAGCGRIGFGLLAGNHGDDDAATSNDRVVGDGAADAAAPARECAGLAATCGPDGTSSCCGNSLIPGGTFLRGNDAGSDHMYTSTMYPATVGDFRFDTYEITVGRFRQFVASGLGTQASPPTTGAGARMLNGETSYGGWDASWNTQLETTTAALEAALDCNVNYQTWTASAGSNENLPINCLTWLEAFAFCTWDGGFLPTDAEWNYAAVGGSDQRAFPWSSPPSDLTIDCSYANYAETLTTQCANPPNGAIVRVGSESPKGDGRWGQADLAGNVLEATLDRYAVYQTPCDNCATLPTASADTYLEHGGDFLYDPSGLRGTVQFGGGGQADRSHLSGARCARAP